MGLFNWFPYTNFHELNLDWITDTIKRQGDAIKSLQESGGVDSLYTVYNVEDYGAQRDGASDLATAINTIIATKSHAPGVIYIPAGEWWCTRNNVNVNIPSGWTIAGDGVDRTRIRSRQANDNGTLFGVGNASFVHFRDFSLWMKESPVHIMDGIGVGNCSLVICERLRIETEWKAITCQGGNGSLVRIVDCDFVDNRHSAIAWENESDAPTRGLHVENCRFKITPGVKVQDQNTMGSTAGAICALYMYANASGKLGDVRFINCNMEGSQIALYSTNAEHVAFDNCQFNGATLYNTRGTTDVVFRNCTGVNLAGGVMLQNTNNVQFINSTLDFAAAPSLGASGDGAENVLLDNCHITIAGNGSFPVRQSFRVIHTECNTSGLRNNGLMLWQLPTYTANASGGNTQTSTVQGLIAEKDFDGWHLRGWVYLSAVKGVNASICTFAGLTPQNDRFIAQYISGTNFTATPPAAVPMQISASGLQTSTELQPGCLFIDYRLP